MEDEPIDLEAYTQRKRREIEDEATGALYIRRLPDGIWPSITPGPDSSTDLWWQLPTRKLLINLPADRTKRATYYGDDRGGNTIKGELNADSPNNWLLEWLTED